jgi:NAD(P)H-quinone oxidoreductase subunit 6
MNLFDSIQDSFFVFLSVVAIAGSLGVVLLPNLVYSAFLLGGVLVCIAAMFLLLNADFIAAALVLLYVGAINVLILFAIMLVKRNTEASDSLEETLSESKVTSVNSVNPENAVKAGLSLGLFILLGNTILSTQWLTSPFVAVPNSVQFIGRHIFSDFLLPFELVSILLLVALIGAIILARREQLAKMTTEIVSK